MNRNSNKLTVPEAKAAMERFKMEAANEVGVPEGRLQRRSDLPSGRLGRRPDGQEDDRGIREQHQVTHRKRERTTVVVTTGFCD